MITLESLNKNWASVTRDSGYMPSPSNSYAFSSSDDEDLLQPTKRPDGMGITPPIAIPNTSRQHKIFHKLQDSKETTQKKLQEKNSSDKIDDVGPPERRIRVNSCPETMKKPTFQRKMYQPTMAPVMPTPKHSRNWSTPVTTPEGQPVLLPPRRQLQGSREGLIDLADENNGEYNI